MENYRSFSNEQLESDYNKLKSDLDTHRGSESRLSGIRSMMSHIAFEQMSRERDIQREIDQAWSEHDNA